MAESDKVGWVYVPMQAAQIWIRRTLKCVVFGLMITTLFGALHDVSRAWDVWSYHMPFAARLVGIVPRDFFTFDAGNEARFQGFPVLGELLQGWLWRLIGRPEAANLVAFSSVPVYGLFLRHRFGVPLYLSTLGLLAVPLVQLHMTSCYVDLPGNTAAAVLILLALESYTRSEPPTVRTVILAVFAAAVAANTKALLHPVVFTALTLLALRAAVLQAGAGFFATHARRLAALGAISIVSAVIFATPLKNLAAHGNPYYPLDFTILGHHFPGLEQPYESSPRWLASAPRPLRFVASILELHSAPLADRHRWTVQPMDCAQCAWLPHGRVLWCVRRRATNFLCVSIGSPKIATDSTRWRRIRTSDGAYLSIAAVARTPLLHVLDYCTCLTESLAGLSEISGNLVGHYVRRSARCRTVCDSLRICLSFGDIVQRTCA